MTNSRGSRSKSPKRSSSSRGSGSGSLVKGPIYKSSSHTKSNVLSGLSNKEYVEMPYVSHIEAQRRISKTTGQPGALRYTAYGYSSSGAGKKKMTAFLKKEDAQYISKEYGVKIKTLADRAAGTRKPRKATCEARKAKKMALVQEAFDDCIEKRRIRRKRASGSGSKSPKRSSGSRKSKSRGSKSKKTRATTSGASKKRKATKKKATKKKASKRASH
jgi:hypothetical protein